MSAPLAPKRRLAWNTRLALLAGTIAYLAWLVRSARTLGFCRDESFYFDAAMNHARWFKTLLEAPKRAVERGAVDGAFSYNHEHPSFMKNLFGLSWAYLHEKWHLFDDASTSFRFPGMVMACLAILATYSMGQRFYGRVAGLFAAGALALMPRVFYHAHLACFDVGIMAMITLSVWAYERAHSTGKPGWIVAFGVIYGMTLDTKHNAWMLPAVFVGHALFVAFTGRLDLRKGARLFAPIASMAILGPLVCWALWPWLWNDTQPRVREYVAFHMNHEYYNMEFLGRNYFKAPSPPLYAPVMIATTVPTITLVLFAVGLFERGRSFVALLRARLRERTAQPDWAWRSVQDDALVVAALLVPLAVFFLPATPIFGGTKHWFPAYPFLAILAGRGFALARARLFAIVRARAPKVPAGAFAGALGLLLLAAPFAATAHSHPYGLSAYVPLAGGTRGGASLGLNRQFWGFTTQSLAPFLEREARPGERIFIHDTTWSAFSRMQQEKRIRADVSGVGSPTDGDLAIVHHELHMAEADTNLQTAFGPNPVYVLTHDGVPIISVYRRPGTGGGR